MHGPGARPLLCKDDLTEYNLTEANTDTGVLIRTVPEGGQLLCERGSNASLLASILTLDMDFAFPAYTTVQGLRECLLYWHGSPHNVRPRGPFYSKGDMTMSTRPWDPLVRLYTSSPTTNQPNRMMESVPQPFGGICPDLCCAVSSVANPWVWEPGAEIGLDFSSSLLVISLWKSRFLIPIFSQI